MSRRSLRSHSGARTGSSLASLLAGVLALGPAMSLASPPEGAEESADEGAAEAAPEEAPDPKLQEAKVLFDAGAAHYDAAEYNEAITLWVAANRTLPSVAEYALVKAQLTYNISRAHQKWYEIDHDVTRLRKARQTLSNFAESIDEIYDEDEALVERTKVEGLIEEIDAAIEAHEAEQARLEAERNEQARPKFDPELDRREYDRNHRVIRAGIITTSIGGLGLVTLGIGAGLASGAEGRVGDYLTEDTLAEREAQLQAGAAGNGLMFVGTIVGALCLITGVPLLASGTAAEKRRKAYRLELENAGVVPMQRGLGLSVRARF